MRQFCFLLLFCILPSTALTAPREAKFKVEKVAEDVYAAVARPGGGATSNAFFVVGERYVVAGGAHLDKAAVEQLIAEVKAVTAKPIRYFILPHHHPGFTAVDFDFPPEMDVVMSWQTWQALSGEPRKPGYPVLFFNDGLTLNLGKQTLILSNLEKGHTAGDTLVYIPERQVLFASDLLYFDCVGYMGSGHMQEWALALEFIGRLEAGSIIPGCGPVGTPGDAADFTKFFKAFLTEVLRHIEAGDSLDRTLRTFALPGYEDLPGYRQFLRVNVERAFNDLKTTLKK